MSKMQRPVIIFTLRNEQPYVLFGKHHIPEPGNNVKAYRIEDGPHIEKWEVLLDQMERDGRRHVDRRYERPAAREGDKRCHSPLTN